MEMACLHSLRLVLLSVFLLIYGFGNVVKASSAVSSGAASCILSLKTVPQWSPETIDVHMDISGMENPFDYSENAVYAVVSTPSKSSSVVVDAFLYQSFNRSLVNGYEVVNPTSDPFFRIMYTPSEIGSFSVSVLLTFPKNGTRNVLCENLAFDAVAERTADSPWGGFVKLSATHQHFQLDNGDSLFLIGENMAWPSGKGTYDYDDWLKKLGAAGGNYIRVWSGPFDVFSLETVHTGLKHYDLGNAWRLDYVFELALSLGFVVELTMESYNPWAITASASMWSVNPYNSANGGPLSEPSQFWKTADTVLTYENRLRYLVARYGHHVNLLSWQFFNEVDLTEGALLHAFEITEWHAERAAFVRSVDPYHHLLTTSFSMSVGWPSIQGSACVDYISTHMYNNRDFGKEIITWNDIKWDTFRKPHFMEEFGIGSASDTVHKDPTGIVLHNGLWASIASISAGGGGVWWWDLATDPLNLYHKYAAFSLFVKRIPWAEYEWTPVLFDKAPSEADAIIGGIRTVRSEVTWMTIWVRNANYSWSAQDAGAPLNVIPSSEISWWMEQAPVDSQATELGNVGADLTAQWFDTESGTVVQVSPVTCILLVCSVSVPSFRTDMAAIVHRR
eukprot:ANDGO_03246.mRNA.1 hypothetical protein